MNQRALHTHKRLYDFTLDSLADMELPDFTKTDAYFNTRHGYMPLFNFSTMTDESIHYFQEEISKRSGGKVSFIAHGHDGETQGASQLCELVSGDARVRFVFGPYAQSHAFRKI